MAIFREVSYEGYVTNVYTYNITFLHIQVYGLKYVTIYFILYLYGIKALRFHVTYCSVRTCTNSSCLCLRNVPLKIIQFP